ncbi:MAG: Sensor protein ZraS [Candidatus Ordinivivax streblomastigis]|uniref:histidine kinase n=1 Tax=Candidatus Ordinivivax streblomastigis TaxID=2540710 RepID=A0A5M8P105_9BACT|nr:MAG: Sensor protein ZraS [Candidatus Ordinivivax streblomastigis]
MKYFFIITAVIIAIASVLVTNTLVNELKEEERKKIEIWAESVALISAQTSMEAVNSDAFNNYDKLLVEKIIEGNMTIPIILTDEDGNVIEKRNIQSPQEDEPVFIAAKIKLFKKKHAPITINIPLGEGETLVQYIYYDDSTVLKQLQLFPFIQLTVVFIFIIISFLALNSTQKAEQNKVWVGLSKETAHQLGTPISSLMAWVEYLKTKNTDLQLLTEMDKDVQRLKTIAERFSKIGSNADPEPLNLQIAIHHAVEYMEKRISSKVSISTDVPQEPIIILMNESLFSWTIENLIKNAVDAMDGQGEIHISIARKGKRIILDIADTGKGIPKSKFKTVFHPGYTTKQRGWGLGLSLVKRIIESYQKGKITVYKSELGKGTTFRVELNV